MITLGIAIVEEDGPIFWDPPKADRKAAESFANFCKAMPARGERMGARVKALFAESNSYSLAASIRPKWSEKVSQNATSGDQDVFGMCFSMMPNVTNCRPKLGIRSAERLAPGFNAELKTMGNKGLFDGASTYVALDMMRSFFTNWNPGDSNPTSENTSLFYKRPPLGYALCGAPPLGWVVAIELVGRLFVSAYSKPFFLGSEEHQSIIRELDEPSFEEPVDLAPLLSKQEKAMWKVWRNSTSVGGRVLCTKKPVSGNLFYKVKTWNAIKPEFQKRCAAANKMYSEARKADSSAPEALVEATLLFGCGKIAVQMPFILGTHPTDDELASPDGTSNLCVRLAAALLWLLGHDLLYTDLRPPNVLVLDEGSVRLIDYDDMRVVAGLGIAVKNEGTVAVTAAFVAAAVSGEKNFIELCPGIRLAMDAALGASGKQAEDAAFEGGDEREADPALESSGEQERDVALKAGGEGVEDAALGADSEQEEDAGLPVSGKRKADAAPRAGGTGGRQRTDHAPANRPAHRASPE